MSADNLLEVVGEIYQAGVDPEMWSSVVVKIAGMIGATSGTIHFIERDTGRVDVLGFDGFDGGAFDTYEQYYHRVDLLSQAVFRLPPARCFVGPELVDPDTFEKSEIYTDFFRPLDICHVVGGLPMVTGDVGALIGFHRPRSRDPFETSDAETLNLLFPHLAQATRVHSRITQLNARIDALESIYDHWPTGVILTDPGGLVVWCNRRAEKMLRDNDGLTTSKQRLLATHPLTNRGLRELLRSAATFDGKYRPSGNLAVPRPSCAEPYSVLVAPLPPHNGSPFGTLNQPLAVVFVSDPTHIVNTPAEALQRLHGLTPAEARLAEALMVGNCLRDAAEILSITEGTARSYLKRVLHKTGACRQSDLVRIVLSGLAPIFESSMGA